MARKSKAAENDDKTKDSVSADATDQDSETSESTSDNAPVVIEGEAVEETDAPDEAEQTTDAPEEAEQTTDAPDELKQTTDAPEESEKTVEVDEPPDHRRDVALTPQPEKRRASFLPMVLGGAVAAGLGFLAALYVWPPSDDSALDERFAQSSAEIQSLSAELEDMRAQSPAEPDLSSVEEALSGLAARLDGIEADLAAMRDNSAAAGSDLEERLSALSERITVIETAGPGESPTAEATEEELTAFRSELDRMAAEAETRVAKIVERAEEMEAAAAEQAAAAQAAVEDAERQAAEAQASADRAAAIVDLKVALESGAGYGDLLPMVGDAPDVLRDNAEGVPTVLSLQQDFPDAARAALAAAQTIPQEASTGERLTAFLKRQTNARSLTPKDGNSADAILSRAESSLNQGDLGGALAELEALPEPAKAAMDDWLSRASTRLSAIEAADQLEATN